MRYNTSVYECLISEFHHSFHSRHEVQSFANDRSLYVKFTHRISQKLAKNSYDILLF